MQDKSWIFYVLALLFAATTGWFLHGCMNPPPEPQPVKVVIKGDTMRIPYPVTKESVVVVTRYKTRTDTVFKEGIQAKLYTADSTFDVDQAVIIHRSKDDTAFSVLRKTRVKAEFLGAPFNFYQSLSLWEDPFEVTGTTEVVTNNVYHNPWLQIPTELSVVAGHPGGAVGLKFSDFEGRISWHESIGTGYHATKYWTVIP